MRGVTENVGDGWKGTVGVAKGAIGVDSCGAGENGMNGEGGKVFRGTVDAADAATGVATAAALRGGGISAPPPSPSPKT